MLGLTFVVAFLQFAEALLLQQILFLLDDSQFICNAQKTLSLSHTFKTVIILFPFFFFFSSLCLLPLIWAAFGCVFVASELYSIHRLDMLFILTKRWIRLATYWAIKFRPAAAFCSVIYCSNITDIQNISTQSQLVKIAHNQATIAAWQDIDALQRICRYFLWQIVQRYQILCQFPTFVKNA